MGEGEHPMAEVAPGRQQFVVVAADKVLPEKIGIPGLRHHRGHVVAQRVGREVVQIDREFNDDSPALGELAPLQIHEFVGRDVVGEVQAAGGVVLVQPLYSDQLTRPDDGVEGDVVFADEVVRTGRGVVPPLLPGLGAALVAGPLNTGGEVADDGLKPDVEPLPFVAGEGDGDAPFDVPGDGPALEPGGDVVAGEGQDVGPPVLLVLIQVGRNPLLEGGQVQEKVLRLPGDWDTAVYLAAGVDEVQGVQQTPAVVALVAPCFRVAAVGAGPFHVPVRKEDAAGFRVELHLGLAVDVPPLQQPQEDVLRHSVVVLRVGVGEEVITDADTLLGVQETGMVALKQFPRGDAFLLGPNGDGGAVGIGAGDHEDVVAGQAMVAGEDVGGQVGTR